MAIERTLSIIKPDAVAKNVIGQIYSRFEGAGLKVIAARWPGVAAGSRRVLRRAQGASLLQGSGLLHDLRSGDDPGLEGENAIAKNRELMGATDPKKADKPAPSAPISPSRSTPTRCMVPTAEETAPWKLPSFSRRMNVYSAAIGPFATRGGEASTLR
jgi:nucleoside-diphosphate kinase